MVFIISAQKGGKGKSVLTALIANSLAIDYHKKVLVIDGDEQGTIADVRKEDGEVTQEFPYEVLHKPVSDLVKEKESLQKYLTELIQKDNPYDIIFVDLQGSVSDQRLIDILLFADGVLIPIVGQQADQLSDKRYIQTIKRVEEYKIANVNPDFKLFAVLNRKRGWVEEREIAEFCQDINVSLFDSSLRDLAIYSRFNTYESYVSSNSPDVRQVKQEFGSFMDELVKKYKL